MYKYGIKYGISHFNVYLYLINYQLYLMAQENNIDSILMNILHYKGNIHAFFDKVYGFLRRKTDFFADPKEAEQIIINSWKINLEIYNTEAIQKLEEEVKKKQKVQKQWKLKEKKQRKQKQWQATEAKLSQLSPPKAQVFRLTSPSQRNGKAKKSEDSLPMPKRNGGRTEKYIWTQTLENLQMYIFLDSALTKKNFLVMMTFSHFSVVVNGVLLIEGQWRGKITRAETYWKLIKGTIDDYKGKYIYVYVQKCKESPSWWISPFQSDFDAR